MILELGLFALCSFMVGWIVRGRKARKQRTMAHKEGYKSALRTFTDMNEIQIESAWIREVLFLRSARRSGIEDPTRTPEHDPRA